MIFLAMQLFSIYNFLNTLKKPANFEISLQLYVWNDLT